MEALDFTGTRVLLLDGDGPLIARPDQANDLIGDAWGHEATVVAIPASRLDAGFFRLSSGLAGEVAQKLVNYRITLAILGDIAAHVEASGALRDFVWESNRGDHVWFLADRAELEARLERRAP
ncbi:DUF4180 domain-containing protein [Mycetocola manganoxydans]|uniref:DUF4180 domain-containing protein n=1 Tax=Mycetocola manganoxydans TaxID=699879 RepID=A0A3L6ZRM2_9MICO|nr:DUF4180 domain-containing protein [Mycetocola manganoxydans]RLP70275.1 DUF4180 domain-containing protein [Mycetocola manganoxydans]GHD49664.1 hypothetical protein GCM10008097_22790 [Mycetocola manganoxydans]